MEAHTSWSLLYYWKRTVLIWAWYWKVELWSNTRSMITQTSIAWMGPVRCVGKIDCGLLYWTHIFDTYAVNTQPLTKRSKCTPTASRLHGDMPKSVHFPVEFGSKWNMIFLIWYLTALKLTIFTSYNAPNYRTFIKITVRNYLHRCDLCK